MQNGSFIPSVDSSLADFLCKISKINGKITRHTPESRGIALHSIQFMHINRFFWPFVMCQNCVSVCAQISFCECLMNKSRQSIQILFRVHCAVYHSNLHPFCLQCTLHTHLNITFHHKLSKWTVLTQTNLLHRKLNACLFWHSNATNVNKIRILVRAFSTLIWLDFVRKSTLTAYIHNSDSLLNTKNHKLILSHSFLGHSFIWFYMLCIQYI